MDLDTSLVRVQQGNTYVEKSLSQLLDLITTTPGKSIVRGTSGWESQTAGTGTGTGDQSPSDNTLISGGGVSLISNLSIRVSAATYQIQGVRYSSSQANLTAETANGSNPRIDVVVVNTAGVASIVTGSATATPVKPDVDPVTQLELTFFLVPTGATSLSTNVVDVYHENTEYTTSESGGHITLASTNNPNAGTKCIEGTAVVANDYFQFAAPGDIDLGANDSLVLNLRSKASWPANKQLTITSRETGVVVGSSIALKHGTFGFNSASTADYQQAVIPLSLFSASGRSVNQLRFTCSGGGGSIGFYVDDVTLQGGLASVSDATRMRWRGNWSSVLFYNTNDVVVSSSIQYVALQPSVNKTPASNTAYWQPSSSGPAGSTTQFQYNNAGVFGGIANATFNGTTITFTDVTLSGKVTSGSAAITTLNAMGALSIDVTKTLNTKTISGNQTFTFSGTPATVDTWFSMFLQNSSGAAVTATIPSSKSISQGGSAITTVSVPANGAIHLTWHYDGTSYWVYGNDPSGISDTAFSSSWDGATSNAPSKNAVYDIFGDKVNYPLTVYGVGTAYALTNAAATITFGTTSPTKVIDKAGTYLILAQVLLNYNAATVVNETATLKVRRTNNTAADISTASPVITLPAATTLTYSYGIVTIPPFIYTTANTNDSLSIQGSVSATLGAGTIDAIAIGTSMISVKLY